MEPKLVTFLEGADDPVGDLLDSTGLCCRFMLLWEMGTRWCLRFPGVMHSVIHIVVQGRAWMEVPNRDPLPLKAGQCVMLPSDPSHLLRSEASPGAPFLVGPPPRPTTRRILRFVFGSPAHATVLTLPFGHPLQRMLPMFGPLPDCVVLSTAEDELGELVAPLVSTVRRAGPGDGYVACRLADALLARALQVAFRQSTELPDLKVLVDTGLMRAFTKLNEDLAHPWTVDLLARLAGMSRSRFADVFRGAVGTSVQQYVRNRRIRHAQQLLLRQDQTLLQVASAVGFRSESSFNRAFLSVTGQRPGRFRAQEKAKRASPPPGASP